jgi:hypothetical protein
MLAMCDHEDWNMKKETIASLSRDFVLLGFGSSFYHASQTKLGQLMDSIPISLIAYTAFQSAMEPLVYSPVTHELAEEGRPDTGVEASEKFARVIMEKSVYDWYDTTKERGVPQYEKSFIAIGNLVLNLVFSPRIAKEMTKFMVKLLLPKSDEVDFFVNSFQPTLVKLLESGSIRLPVSDRISLLSSGVGTLLKLVSHNISILVKNGAYNM